MRKLMAFMLLAALTATNAGAQSKVFKEVNDEISTQIKTIRQDEALVGYLAFTQLEKTSEDSFNYRITIMDENLNDIGKVNFKQENLQLQSVAFEGDVLCLAYLKSNVMGKNFTSNKVYKKAIANDNTAVLTQFLNLEGKILKTNSNTVDVKLKDASYSYNTFRPYATLKHSIQLKNIKDKGFACFFGDESTNQLLVFNTKGQQTWKKKITDAEGGFVMLASNDNVYLLSKTKVDKTIEGGYEVQGYNTSDSSTLDKISLKDKKGNYLKVLAFQNDPVTNKPYISGNIINQERSEKFIRARHVAKGAYSGVFTINLQGPKKSDIKEMYSYWGDGSMNPTISDRGYYGETKNYAKYYESIRDFNGNTYFVGSSFIKRPRIGSIISCTILSPLLYPAIALAALGTSKCKFKDAVMLKQSSNGALTVENSIPCNNSSFFSSKLPLENYQKRTFYNVNNNDSKTNYVIIDDVKDIVIYNVNQKKIARTVHHKDGNIMTNIYPAKEGHIMVSEYNKKEKYSKLSIESL